MAKFLVFGVQPVAVLSPELFGLTFEAEAEPVMIGIHPEMAFDLAMLILNAYEESSSARRLGAPRPPAPIERIRLESLNGGVELTIDLPERGPRLTASLEWPVARSLAARLNELLADAQHEPPPLN